MFIRMMRALIPVLAATIAASNVTHAQQNTVAIVGATLIDGNGSPPVEDAVILVENERITAVGERGHVDIPPSAQTIDATGKYITPGFIDTNVHLSIYGGNTNERYETLVRYEPRQHEVVLEAAQM